MLPNQLSILSVLALPRNSVLYKVTDETMKYVLKASRYPLAGEKEAFSDEYHTMVKVSHPVLPKYYDYFSDLNIPHSTEPVPAVLMEYVEGEPFTSIPYLTTKELKKYIMDLGSGLLALLNHGVLYMDLHPGNLLIQQEQIRLIDLTKAYYFLSNPNPSYIPKISYHLNQHLAGQQLLIQELTLFLLHLPEQFSIAAIPPSLLHLGQNPHSGITFSEFLDRLENEWEA